MKNKTEKRDYQQQCWKALKKARKQGQTKALLHLATGLGKTYIAIQDIKESKAKKVLFTAHMIDILHEAKTEAERQGVDHLIDFQTLQYLRNNLDKIPSDTYDYIVYDEAHHIKADSYAEVFNHFKPKFCLGLTATPHRFDGKKISEFFGEPIFIKSLAQALAEGWLSKVDYRLLLDDGLKNAINKGFSGTSLKSLKELLAAEPRNQEIVSSIVNEKKRLKLEKASTIVFCQGIEHAEKMASLLKGKAYHTNLSKNERTRIFSEFSSGKLETICTVDTFNEGVNIPEARLLVFLRSTASKTVYFQQLGRGLRKTKTKEHVTVLDFAANVERLRFIQALTTEIAEAKEATTENPSGTTGAFTFEGGSFTFSKEVVDIIDYLDELDTDFLEGELKIKDLAAKYSKDPTSLQRLIKAQGFPLIQRRLTRQNSILAEDWQKFIQKNPHIVATVSEGITVKDIMERHNLKSPSIVCSQIRKLGDVPLRKKRNKDKAYVLTPQEYQRLQDTFPKTYKKPPYGNERYFTRRAIVDQTIITRTKIGKIIKDYQIKGTNFTFRNGRIGTGFTKSQVDEMVEIFKKEYQGKRERKNIKTKEKSSV